MRRAFYISHHVSLGEGDAERLQEPGAEVSVDGVCVPVFFDDGHTTEPAAELFASYHIYNRQDKFIIRSQPAGFILNLSDADRLHSLLPIGKNGGSDFLAVCVTDNLTTEKYGKIPIFHQIVINPASIICQSSQPCHLPQSACKDSITE